MSSHSTFRKPTLTAAVAVALVAFGGYTQREHLVLNDAQGAPVAGAAGLQGPATTELQRAIRAVGPLSVAAFGPVAAEDLVAAAAAQTPAAADADLDAGPDAPLPVNPRANAGPSNARVPYLIDTRTPGAAARLAAVVETLGG